MIVVVGLPALRESGGESSIGGVAAVAAAAARQAGREVELAGKIGDDVAGDAVVLALGRLGIGHAALLRDPARPTPLVVDAAGDGADEETADEEPADAEAPRLLPADPAERPALEAGDVDLALRYLAAAAVVVVAEPLPADVVAAAAAGATFSGARLVVAVTPGSGLPELPGEAIVLEAPQADDGSFARFVGALAAGLDSGLAGEEAFASAVRSTGWEHAPADEESEG